MDLSLFSLLGLAVGLALDAFAVSIAAGLAVAAVTPRHVFRVSFHFGLFQLLMPITGWLAGGQLAAYFGPYNRWAAFGLLAYVGGRMLWEAHSEKKADSERDSDPRPDAGNAFDRHEPRRPGGRHEHGAAGRFGVGSRGGDWDYHGRAVSGRHHVRRPNRPALGVLGRSRRRNRADRDGAESSLHGIAARPGRHRRAARCTSKTQ